MANRQIIEVNAQVQWVYFQDKTGNQWIATCPPLRLTIEADTHTELREKISDAMNLLMRTMLRSGELDGFLRERGWSRRQNDIDEKCEVFFDVPIELTAGQQGASDFKTAVRR